MIWLAWSSGKQLVTVGMDDNHTMNIWSWEKGKQEALMEPSTPGVPTGKELVMGVIWCKSGGIVSYGEKYAKLWLADSGGLKARNIKFGADGPVTLFGV